MRILEYSEHFARFALYDQVCSCLYKERPRYRTSIATSETVSLRWAAWSSLGTFPSHWSIPLFPLASPPPDDKIELYRNRRVLGIKGSRFSTSSTEFYIWSYSKSDIADYSYIEIIFFKENIQIPKKITLH